MDINKQITKDTLTLENQALLQQKRITSLLAYVFEKFSKIKEKQGDVQETTPRMSPLLRIRTLMSEVKTWEVCMDDKDKKLTQLVMEGGLSLMTVTQSGAETRFLEEVELEVAEREIQVIFGRMTRLQGVMGHCKDILGKIDDLEASSTDYDKKEKSILSLLIWTQI